MINVEGLHNIILMCTFPHVYLSGDPRVQHLRIHDQSRAFHSLEKRPKAVGHSLGIDIDFSDGCILLDGIRAEATIRVKSFVKTKQSQS